MKITKKILGTASAVALLSMGSIFADEFDSFDSGDSAGFGDFTEEYTEPALNFNGEANVKGRLWLGNVTKDGEYVGANRYKYNVDNISGSETQADAQLKLDLSYNGANTDLTGKLKLDTATIKEHPEDVIEEIVARGYFGNWQIEAGKMKNVWGKGDKIHVLDNFNANDYTDFVFPDYIDRRLAEPMLKVSYASTYSNDYISDIKFEVIGTPMMTADRFASSGLLVPYSQTKLTNTVTDIMKHNLAVDVTGLSGNEASVVGSILKTSSFTSDDLYEDKIKSIKYGQFGTRFTGTFRGIDFGASYYYGHYKQPSANLGNFITSLSAAAGEYAQANLADFATPTGKYYGEVAQYVLKGYSQTDAVKKVVGNHAQEWLADGELVSNSVYTDIELPSLNYDQVQVFGLEAAFVMPIIPLNTRWEVAYNLTEDTTGDNPWVKNNSIGWVAGFDIDLPIHNFNINFQEQGKYILKNNKIKDGTYAEYDVDYNSDDKYVSNQFVVNISDKFLHEKLTAECTTIYVLETEEWCVQPKVAYNVIDGLTFTLSGAYIYSNNENGQFYNFTAQNDRNHNISFVQLAAKYQF